MTWLSGG
jgi:hypothetical protein